MKTFLLDFIFKGKIPGRKWLQKLLILLAALTPLIWYFPEYWRDLGLFAWVLIVVIMLVRPLYDVFPKIGLFCALIPLRKELGILSAMLVLSHASGFYLSNNLPILSSYFDFQWWTFDDDAGYAHLAGVFAFILLITSNKWSQLKLKRNWKRIQFLSYPFFITGAMHIYLVDGEYAELALSSSILVLVFWSLAQMKIVLWKP